MSKFCLFFVFSVFLVSCAVGPDYSTPEANIFPHFENTPDRDQTDTDTIEWWLNFKDDTLTNLITESHLTNLDLKIAESRILQARGERLAAFSPLLPDLSGTGSFRRSAPQDQDSSDYLRPEIKNSYQAGFDASWEIDFFGRNRRVFEASGADLREAIENLYDVRITLDSEIASHYMTLRALQEKYSNAKDNLRIIKDISAITSKRFEAGFESGLSFSQIKAELATEEAKLSPLESAIKSEVYAISLLLGKDPSALNEVLLDTKPIPEFLGLISPGLPSDLLRRRPDIRAAEERAHAATARVGVATADFFPRFSLTGFFGFEGSRFSDLGDWKNRLWDMGALGNLPIFNAGKLLGALRASQSIRDQRIIDYQKTILTALTDVENSLLNYKAYSDENELLKSSVENNEKALSLSFSLYQEGLIEFLQVLNAERSLITSKNAFVENKRNILLSVISLYKALGGSLDIPQEGDA